METKKIIRITTIPLSLGKLLEGQLRFMSSNYEVVAISSDEMTLKKVAEREGVRYFSVAMTRSITPLRDIRAIFKMYRIFKKEKPSIVHTHTPKAGLVGMLAAFLARVPHRLHTVAGLPLMETTGSKRRILDIVEKLTYVCATKIYPNSKGLQEFILKENFAQIDKLKIIGNGSSNGINVNHFDPNLFDSTSKNDLRKELKISTDDFLFIFVGRLVKDKGINELVEAFQKLQKAHEHTSLLLVGRLETKLDPLSPETLLEINTNSKIYAVGYKTDVRPYLAISDALTFPSYREGFPNVVMQAGAMNLPAVVSNINGCNEIIENNTNGLIIESKNALELEIAMGKLLENTTLYDYLKSNARPNIVSKYRRDLIWTELLREYDSLFKKGD